MKSELNLGNDVGVPLNVMTLATAVLANRGAGKTYFASVLAEELLAAGQQVIIIDPVGVLWGLKTGYAIPVFGGGHADVPLQPASGDALAAAIVKHRFSAILDLSEMTNSDSIRFVGDFLHELYRKNRESCYVIVDEADMFAPQGQTSGNSPKCLGAMQHMVRRGRARGLGCALVTQRPQAIAKDVLTQCEILVALRMSHPRDIDAVEEWVNTQASASQAKDVVKSLPSLPTGEAWFWAPSLQLFKRAKVRKRQTFDSSATPEPGEARVQPKEMRAVDLKKLGTQIVSMVEEEKAKDPSVLRRRIVELERGRGDSEALVALREQIDSQNRQLQSLRDHAYKSQKILDQIGILATSQGPVEVVAAATPIRKEVRFRLSHRFGKRGPFSAVQPVREKTKHGASSVDMPTGERAVLRVLAQYAEGLRRPQIGVFSGYIKRSTRDAYIQRLQQKGYVEQAGVEEVRITEQGLDAVGEYEALPVGRDLQQWWISKLPKGEAEILGALCAEHGAFVAREEIGDRTGYTARSTRDAYIQRLAQKMLVISTASGVRAAEELF